MSESSSYATVFQVTKTLEESLKLALNSSECATQLTSETKAKWQDLLKSTEGEQKSISLTDVMSLVKLLNDRKTKEKSVWFHELVDGAKLVYPEKPITPTNPEIEKKRKEWKKVQEQHLYEKMTACVRPYTKEDERRDQTRLVDFKSQLGIGHHMIAVFGCVFFCGYQFFKYSLDNEAMALIGGIFSAIAMLMVEVFLFIIRTNKVDNHSVDISRADKRRKKQQQPPKVLLQTQ